ncbi:signal peptidase II [Cereibacter azotoformans]|uniref:signal peptidase II n=1 Tax=Cereibacter azotoformans TaxID=43057 RepID=UPI000C6DFA8A|nr:signal peptidase II [Cereibacter azotoformans]ULB10915.1 signal peptidase II [Cereibacter azotoformans]
MRLTALTALIVFLIDQATKWIVVWGLGLAHRGAIDLVAPWLTFRMAWNRGINFGIGSSDQEIVRWGLIAVSLAISAWVWRWVGRSEPSRMARVSGGLLIGGAIGNVVDRILYGAVADFLNMSCCGIENPYAFNVADIAIFAGAFGLVLFTRETKPAPGKAGAGAAKRKPSDGKSSGKSSGSGRRGGGKTP